MAWHSAILYTKIETCLKRLRHFIFMKFGIRYRDILERKENRKKNHNLIIQDSSWTGVEIPDPISS